MTELPEKYTSVYEAFKTGQFSVQLSNNNTFGRIPVDQAIEVTVNKDTQTPGGTSRFSLKAGAVRRYYPAAEHRSAFLGQLREMLQGNKSKLSHSELQSPRIHKDEDAVSAVVSLIQGWINPFDGIYQSKHAQIDITQFIPNSSSHTKCCHKMFNTVNTNCERSIFLYIVQ